jgi:hypothetical protein
LVSRRILYNLLNDKINKQNSKDFREKSDSSNSSNYNSQTSIDSTPNSPCKLSKLVPQSANKHDSPMRSTINELNNFSFNSSDDASTLADDLVKKKKKSEYVKCQGFRPEIENIYCNYPFQMHSSILLKTNDEKKFVFEDGTFHTKIVKKITIVCMVSQ